MYLHLGNNTVVNSNEIIGIFDMDNTTVSKHTRKYLAQRTKNGEVVNVSLELPKSFVVCSSNNKKNGIYQPAVTKDIAEEKKFFKVFVTLQKGLAINYENKMPVLRKKAWLFSSLY